MRSLIKDESGQFAVITALMMVPLVGLTGLSVDYARSTNMVDYMQNRSDAAALAMAIQGPTGTDRSAVNFLVSDVKNRLEADGQLRNVSIEASWTSDVDYTVKVAADIPTTLSRIVPGIGNDMGLSVIAVARFKDITTTWKPPEMAMLDPEAGDYNRIYAYCFNPAQKNDPVTHGRSQEVPIADNGGTTYDTKNFPQCPQGVVSYRLYNVRSARTNPSKWDDARATHYNHYTDTVFNSQMGKNIDNSMDSQAERYDYSDSGKEALELMETVLCDNLSECKPRSQGGVIPSGKRRTPQKNKKACAAGKFMYYGWEDRRPSVSSDGSDRDFDDIRLIIECPTVIISGEKNVRLIR
ncbi:TadE/TadG family type IV pilus assembly protein [Consotaella salsifontis]|uniref:Flp pilus assembly protein TadG n=1 Tax=Consotaella salsifontis TaxID=1365950 RepID=A0A1T4PYU5_9HYPH|nr:TadE/TadG family type IV pilus assembly protein [Consotaella salsifontis]SJZ96712.1 Flp pilus assembly protein TadG [Consotaella salsifontis]